MAENVTHLIRQSGLDSDAWDGSGNLLTFCGRWAQPLNNDQLQRQTCQRASQCTCHGCQRTARFKLLPGSRQ